MGKRNNSITRPPVIQYERMSKDGFAYAYRYQDLFCVGCIPDEIAEYLATNFRDKMADKLYPASQDWADWVKQRTVGSLMRPAVMFVMNGADGKAEVAGASWIDDSRMISDDKWAGEMAFAILPGYREYSFLFARMAIEWAFRENIGLSTLYSFIHVDNRRSVWFSGQLGFEVSPAMPGFFGRRGSSHRGHLVSLTQRHWNRLGTIEEKVEQVADMVQNVKVAGE